MLDSKGIQELFQELAEKHPDKYKDVARDLTRIGGEASYSKGGLSFGVRHLKPALGAKVIRAQLRRELDGILADRSLSPRERELKIIEAVDRRRKPLEDAVYDESLAEKNPLALQVLSGVRGKKMNLRSLRGGDLLYTDHRDRIIPVPVLKSYSEGLSPAEYWAGAFGARRGVVEVKMATADAGFLCLDEDTPVRMADGSARPIKEIQVGDEVLGADVKGETFPTAVTAVFDNGERCVRRWYFADWGDSHWLAFDATDEHRVLGERGGEVAPLALETLLHDDSARLLVNRAFSGGAPDRVFLIGDKLLGSRRTRDIEVDHPDHLFVLANGAIVSNSKQLVQAAHRLIVTNRDEPRDPKAPPRGMMVDADDSDNVGALLAAPAGGYARDVVITPKILKHLQDQGIEKLLVRSPIAGGPPEGGVYAKDVGVREKGDLPPVGDYVGIAAVQALGEKTSQGMLCLAGDTPVRMADGTLRPIREVEVGDMVTGANVEGETFPVRVLNVFDNGERDVVRYRLFSYNRRWHHLDATPDHKVLFTRHIKGRGWVNQVGRLTDLDDEDLGYRLSFFAAGETVYKGFASCYMVEPLGMVRTFDIEVDHPDHLFVIDNNLVVSNSSKHSGGVAGANAASSGFKAINALINPPKIFPGAAAHAQADGLVSSVEPAPQGGWNVSVEGQRHYVPAGYDLKVKPGDRVEAGDVLSAGVPNPAEIVKHKGIGEGRKYFVDTFREVFRNSGLYGNRRNIELLARGLIDHVRLTDEVGDYAPDDIVPYSTLERDWTPRPGAVTTSPSGAVGKYLERPVLHYSIGTRVRPSMLPHLKQFGVDRLEVHHAPPPFQPQMVRGMAGLANDPEWAVRHLGSGLQKSTLSAVHRGSTSDTRGTSFVSALLDPVSFGREGQTAGYKAADLLEDDLLD